MIPLADAERAAELVVPQLKTARWAFYALAAVLAIALVAFLAWWLVVRPRQDHVAAAVAHVAAATATGAAGAAQDAVKVITVHDREIDRIHTITEGGVRDVQAAAGADASSPDVAAALRRSVCLFGTYQRDPGCAALPGTGPSIGAAPADTGSAIAPGR